MPDSLVIRLLLVVFVAQPLALGQTQQTSAQTKPGPRPATRDQSKPVPGQPSPQDSLAEAGATSTSKLALPFKRTWQHLTGGATPLAPTLDEGRIYLPLTGGRVSCLDRQTGLLLWSTEPGGLVTASVAAGENSIYITTQNRGEDGVEAGGSLRAVDKATGLTVWVRDFPRAFSSALELGPGRIYAGSADGFFYALDSKDGAIIWKVESQDVVRGRALVSREVIYFGSDDGVLRAVDPDRGQLIWQYQTKGRIIGHPVADDRVLYFGSGDGYVYSLDISTGKLRWRSRTGAAIEASPVIVGERLLVGSYDNFVYALSRATGDRVWKRRLENRITAAPIVEGDANLVAPLHSDYIAVFLNSDGRRVNIYQLDPDFEIVAAPIFSRDTLVLPTNQGLVVATATKPVEPQTNAIKK
ncbi:MAG TPA: PQQ-binding-like beta-propeller repeat protein [Blastocatellia bacterium]|nr:PQQ-binding-like beta-propeller repeat protein [Blastocatellia bacterium]